MCRFIIAVSKRGIPFSFSIIHQVNNFLIVLQRKWKIIEAASPSENIYFLQVVKILFHVWQFLNSLGIRIAPFCAFFWRELRWRRRSITSVVKLTENSTKLISACDHKFKMPRVCYSTTIPQYKAVTDKLMEYIIVTINMNFARHVDELRFPRMKLRKLRSLVSKQRTDVNWFSLFESWRWSEFVSKIQNQEVLSCQ